MLFSTPKCIPISTPKHHPKVLPICDPKVLPKLHPIVCPINATEPHPKVCSKLTMTLSSPLILTVYIKPISNYFTYNNTRRKARYYTRRNRYHHTTGDN